MNCRRPATTVWVTAPWIWKPSKMLRSQLWRWVAAEMVERPVRVSVTTMVTVRRRQRARRVAGWAVVQRIGRREAEVLPLESVRRRVQHRMMRERYESAREAAGARWEERLRPQVEAAIDARALGTVRVTPRE